MPPAALASSKRILAALADETPPVAVTPDRSVGMPSTISVLVTPRVCAKAPVASATKAAAASMADFLYIVSSLERGRHPWRAAHSRSFASVVRGEPTDLARQGRGSASWRLSRRAGHDHLPCPAGRRV